MDKVQFRVRTEQYTWDDQKQELHGGAKKVYQIQCECGEGLFDIVSFKINGQGVEIPDAFRSSVSSKAFKSQLQSLTLIVHEKAREMWLNS